MANPLPIVLRDHLLPGTVPYSDKIHLPWEGQLEWAGPKTKPIIEMVQQKMYLMRTPSTHATVTVTAPIYDDSKVPENYRFDCNAFATQSYVNFKYTVTSTSLWDVLNDPEIARRVVHNEPDVIPNTTSLIRSGTGILPDDQDISKLVFTENDPRRVQRGDIVVFWRPFIDEADGRNRRLAAEHAMVIKDPVYTRFGTGYRLNLEDTSVDTKNGSEKPEIDSLDEISKKYGRLHFKYGFPVGVYRPVRLK